MKSTEVTLLTEGIAYILGEGEDARGWALAVVPNDQNVPSSRTFQKIKSEYLHVLAHGKKWHELRRTEN